MVIMWPDTTISDDRRAPDNRAGDWTQQVSRVDTGPQYVNRVRSEESRVREEDGAFCKQPRPASQAAPGWKMVIR